MYVTLWHVATFIYPLRIRYYNLLFSVSFYLSITEMNIFQVLGHFALYITHLIFVHHFDISFRSLLLISLQGDLHSYPRSVTLFRDHDHPHTPSFWRDDVRSHTCRLAVHGYLPFPFPLFLLTPKTWCYWEDEIKTELDFNGFSIVPLILVDNCPIQSLDLS